MATRAVRHAEAVAKRERRLAEERESALNAQRKDQEQRYWKSEEAKKIQRARAQKNADRIAAIAAAAERKDDTTVIMDSDQELMLDIADLHEQTTKKESI